jgi:hypothetical protein
LKPANFITVYQEIAIFHPIIAQVKKPSSIGWKLISKFIHLKTNKIIIDYGHVVTIQARRDFDWGSGRQNSTFNADDDDEAR